jgi:hypothetical protein
MADFRVCAAMTQPDRLGGAKNTSRLLWSTFLTGKRKQQCWKFPDARLSMSHDIIVKQHGGKIDVDAKRLDLLREMMPAAGVIGSTGKERLRVSRLAMDVVDSRLDVSKGELAINFRMSAVAVCRFRGGLDRWAGRWSTIRVSRKSLIQAASAVCAPGQVPKVARWMYRSERRIRSVRTRGRGR